MGNVAINVRNRIIRNSFNSNLYYQLSALQEQCQKEIWTEKEIREKITLSWYNYQLLVFLLDKNK